MNSPSFFWHWIRRKTGEIRSNWISDSVKQEENRLARLATHRELHAISPFRHSFSSQKWTRRGEKIVLHHVIGWAHTSSVKWGRQLLIRELIIIKKRARHRYITYQTSGLHVHCAVQRRRKKEEEEDEDNEPCAISFIKACSLFSRHHLYMYMPPRTSRVWMLHVCVVQCQTQW